VVTLLFVLDGIPGVVELLGVVRFTVITSDLNVLLIGRGLALGFRVDLNGGLIWWSSVGLSSGVIAISLLDLRVGSVVVDGSEGPDWLSSRGSSNKEGDSKGLRG
jgi:hypothetical protein